MRRATVLVLILIAGGMMSCQRPPQVDIEAEKQSVIAVMEKINTAWETESLETFSQVVAHDESMVNFGSDVADRWVGWEGLKKGLEQQFEVFSNTQVTPRHMDIELAKTGQLAWLAQAMGVKTEFLGNPVELEARITAVFEKRNDQWLMVQFHYSVPISEGSRLGM